MGLAFRKESRESNEELRNQGGNQDRFRPFQTVSNPRIQETLDVSRDFRNLRDEKDVINSHAVIFFLKD